MQYSTIEDLKRAECIVRKEFALLMIVADDEATKKIAEEIMDISYSKGGDYSEVVISSFAHVYFQEGMYKKILDGTTHNLTKK